MSDFYREWLSIIGPKRFAAINEPVPVKTNFKCNDGNQIALWFSKSSMERELKDMQRFHFNQKNPEDMPRRSIMHPDHRERHGSQGNASTGFMQLQEALGMAKTGEQIWGLMTYGTLFRHCISQKSIGCHSCNDLLKDVKNAMGDLIPAFDPKSHHVLPETDGESVLYKLSSSDANIWIANSHCNLLDNYSIRSISLTTKETDLCHAVRKDIEADIARQNQWRKDREPGQTEGSIRGPKIN
jgi:hypothetical protein